MGPSEGYGRFVTGDLVLMRGSEGAPAPPDVEALYRDASRDAPLCEPPEVATMFARLYGALLARRDVLTVSLREAGRLVGFAYGHPWHWQEQSDPWGAQLRGGLGGAANLLEDSLAVYLLAVDPARRRQGLGGALLDALLAGTGKACLAGDPRRAHAGAGALRAGRMAPDRARPGRAERPSRPRATTRLTTELRGS